VHQIQAIATDRLDEGVERGAHAAGRGQVVPGRERVTGVEADAETWM
jgi:hypothetical protein